jgi:hypothetical protein
MGNNRVSVFYYPEEDRNKRMKEMLKKAEEQREKDIEKSRGHTDDFAEEFLEAGVPPELTKKFALRYIKQELFDEEIETLAEEWMTERPDYRKLLNKNNKLFNIGCDWEGVMDVVEYEDDRVYIPTSGHCMIKCYEKFLNRKLNVSGVHQYAATLNSIKLCLIKNLVNCSCEKKHYKNCKRPETCNCRQAHTPECKEIIDETLSKLPRIVKYGERNGKVGFYRVSDSKTYKNRKQAIVLVPFGDNNYHAILSKINYIHLTEKDLEKIRFEPNKELTAEFRRQPRDKIKKRLTKVYAYDVETYAVGVTDDEKILVPYSLGWCEVDLVNKTIGPITVIEGDSEEYIYNTMFDQITSLPDSPDEIQLFAHNGSRFDHIYAKAATNVRFISQIANGSQIKCLKLQCNGKSILLKDSFLFTQKGLDKSAEALGIDDKKIDLDINDWPKERFQQDRSWIPYLEKDVELLAKVILKFEEALEEFGESMTRYLGIPGLAWKMIKKMCPGVKELLIPSHKSIISFIKESIYGGRVLHWKQEIKEEYVCLDANSLYPSAMGTSKFPIGPAKVIKNFRKFPKKKHLHYIVECEIEAPKIRYPIHPYRTEKRTIIYPIGRFTGVYNEVELNEMKKDGYKIIRYIRGIYWSQFARIFEDFVTKLYNKRVEVGSDTPLGYVLKNLLNAGYGKFLEVIRYNSTFKKSKLGKLISSCPLENGQTEYRNRLFHPVVQKPLHIGSYILSYSRKIMNELINAVGRENIAYGDTDSIYVKKSALPKVNKYLGNGLCKFKNDYGDKVITYGIFLDVKRYYLEFSDGTKRCKFVGLNFKDVKKIADYKDTEITKDVTLLYKTLLTNYHNTDLEDQEKLVKAVMKKWKRSNINVCICKTVTKFMIDPKKRANWDGMEYYPINWDYYGDNVPEFKLKHKNCIGEHLEQAEKIYSMKFRLYYNREGKLILESGLPLTFEKNKISVNHDDFVSNWRTDGEEIYYIYDGKAYKYTEFGYGDEVEVDITKLKPVICWNSNKHPGTEISEYQFGDIVEMVSELNKQ